MGFRFFRRMQLLPGIGLNLSRSGPSLSFGARGAKVTVGRRGVRRTVGIPGTGLFYTSTSGRGRRRRSGGARGARSRAIAENPGRRLTLGFFKRLVTSGPERAFVDGARELALGHPDAAVVHLRKATDLPDGAWLAACAALRRERYEEAIGHLELAQARARSLGRTLAKYGISASVDVAITEEISASVGADLRGVLLLLIEARQEVGKLDEALDSARRLARLMPDDVVVRLSLVELLDQTRAHDRRIARRILTLTDRLDNDSPVHAALLLYRARALRALGMNEAARDVLSRALRRKKGRSEDLMLALRYERALTYAAMGQNGRARKDLERIYAEDSGYEDVAQRLDGAD